MAEPPISLGEWVAVAVSSALAGMGGAMAWFSHSRREVMARMEKIDGPDGRMADYESGHAQHATDIAVVKTCQEHTADRLEEINTITRDTNMKLDKLIEKLLQK